MWLITAEATAAGNDFPLELCPWPSSSPFAPTGSIRDKGLIYAASDLNETTGAQEIGRLLLALKRISTCETFQDLGLKRSPSLLFSSTGNNVPRRNPSAQERNHPSQTWSIGVIRQLVQALFQGLCRCPMHNNVDDATLLTASLPEALESVGPQESTMTHKAATRKSLPKSNGLLKFPNPK